MKDKLLGIVLYLVGFVLLYQTIGLKGCIGLIIVLFAFRGEQYLIDRKEGKK